jgi:hypothetical protein
MGPMGWAMRMRNGSAARCTVPIYKARSMISMLKKNNSRQEKQQAKQRKKAKAKKKKKQSNLKASTNAYNVHV